MKKKKWLLLAPLLVSFGANVCLADTHNDYLAGTYDGYEDVVQKPIYSLINEFDRLSVQMLPVIEEKIRQISPAVVISAKNDSNEVKLVKYNNYLAQKVLDDYTNSFKNYLTEKEKETGRKLEWTFDKDADGNAIEYYWLDRGDLDTDKCKVTYTPKDRSDAEIEKYRRDQREHTCLYPDGFEEYKIKRSPYSLELIIDDQSSNIRLVYRIKSYRRTNIDDPQDVNAVIRLSAFTDQYNYDEWHRYRNQIQQDLKDGLCNIVLAYDSSGPKKVETDANTIPMCKTEIKSDQMIPKIEFEGIQKTYRFNYRSTL